MRTIGRVSPRSLPGFNKLYSDFMEHPEQVKDFYTWDFRNDAAWKGVAEARRLMHRDALSQILVDQNLAFGASIASVEAARRLAHPSTYVVTTGQQLAVYGGCLFYFHKTITAIKLARRLSDLLGLPVVPVFWMEGEDHDFPEVDHLAMPGDRPQRLQLAGMAPGRQPVSSREIPPEIEAFHAEVAASLPKTDFTAPLLEKLAAFYHPGANWVEAFGRLWAYLFPGLVLMNPSDPALKRLAYPIFARECGHADFIMSLLDRRDREIEARGYDVQVVTGYPNFFWIRDGERQPVQRRGTRLVVVDGDEPISCDREHAASFSPKVLLRPVVQDFLLPNLATVAGPSEIAYLAQVEALYSAHNVVPSVAFPRATATLLEKTAAKLFGQSGVSLELLAEGTAAVFDKLKPIHPEAKLFESAFDAVHDLESGLKQVAADLDPTLAGAVDTAREKINYQITNLKSKFTRARYQREDVLTKRIEAAYAQCFPDGELQERVLAGIYVLAKYGPVILDELFSSLQIGHVQHQLLAID